MKTNNIEKQLRDYYCEKKNEQLPKEPPDAIDDNLIARYIEGVATTEETLKIEIAKKTDEELKMLLETVDSINQNAKPKPKISKIFSFSKPQTMILLRCAACILIIVTGSVFIKEKIRLNSETAGDPQITLRGVDSSTNQNQQSVTNKNEKVNSKKN